TVRDQVVPRLALETPDLLGQVAAGDPRPGSVRVLQRPRRDDLRDLVHRPRVLARRRRPHRGHLLVGDPPITCAPPPHTESRIQRLTSSSGRMSHQSPAGAGEGSTSRHGAKEETVTTASCSGGTGRGRPRRRRARATPIPARMATARKADWKPSVSATSRLAPELAAR